MINYHTVLGFTPKCICTGFQRCVTRQLFSFGFYFSVECVRRSLPAVPWAPLLSALRRNSPQPARWREPQILSVSCRHLQSHEYLLFPAVTIVSSCLFLVRSCCCAQGRRQAIRTFSHQRPVHETTANSKNLVLCFPIRRRPSSVFVWSRCSGSIF